jgi:hypothetical protein
VQRGNGAAWTSQAQEATGCWAASTVRLGRRRAARQRWGLDVTVQEAMGCWAATRRLTVRLGHRRAAGDGLLGGDAASDGVAGTSPCSEATGCWAASDGALQGRRRLGEEKIGLRGVSYFALISCVIIGDGHGWRWRWSMISHSKMLSAHQIIVSGWIEFSGSNRVVVSG